MATVPPYENLLCKILQGHKKLISHEIGALLEDLIAYFVLTCQIVHVR